MGPTATEKSVNMALAPSPVLARPRRHVPELRVCRIGVADRASYRVLVDRRWPREIVRHTADLSEWLKAVAPSVELERWYDDVPARFEDFSHAYTAELSVPASSAAFDHLVRLTRTRDVTLLTASHDIAYASATVLFELILMRPRGIERLRLRR